MILKKQIIPETTEESMEESSLPSIIKFSQYNKVYNFKDSISSSTFNNYGEIGNQFYSFSFNFPQSSSFSQLNNTLKKLKDSKLFKRDLFNNFNIFKISINLGSQARTESFVDFSILCFTENGEKIPQDEVGIIKSFYSKEVFILINKSKNYFSSTAKIKGIIFPKINIEKDRLFLNGTKTEDNSNIFEFKKSLSPSEILSNFIISDIKENFDLFLKSENLYYKLDNSLAMIDFEITRPLQTTKVLVATQTNIDKNEYSTDDYFKKSFRNQYSILGNNENFSDNYYNNDIELTIKVDPLISLQDGETLCLSTKNIMKANNIFYVESDLDNRRSANISSLNLFYSDNYFVFGIDETTKKGVKLINGYDFFVQIKEGESLKILKFYGSILNKLYDFSSIEVIPFFDSKRSIDLVTTLDETKENTIFPFNAYLFNNKIYGYNLNSSFMEFDIFEDGNYK